MIPLRDSPKTHRFPLVNTSIIVLNIAIFLWMVSLSQSQLMEFSFSEGLIPANFTQNLFMGNPFAAITSLITYQFLHGGWIHLIGNILYLWVFGDNIEDRLGHGTYLLFYLVVGGVAGLFQVYFNPTSTVPIVGASGAVAGVLGAYLLSCPNARVLTIIPIFIFITIAEIRAVFFLIFWFVIQIFNGVASVGIQNVTVAWWAHIGGFLAGMAFIKLFGGKFVCEER